MTIYNKYVPSKIGKEYTEMLDSYQYPMFISTALGIKPCFDDWVFTSNLKEFKQLCNKYGLFVEQDSINWKPCKNKEEIIGKENITTTLAEGSQETASQMDKVTHVFISKSREILRKVKRVGWYPLSISGRSLNKPFVDHLRFGEILGYPKCCINSFKKYNNWNLYSHPYETYKNTFSDLKDNKPSYYCNNFLMDNSYFFIHHIPCSYNCPTTIEYAQRIEKGIEAVEPEFVKRTKEMLRKPLFVIGERNFILFEGIKEGNQIRYSGSVYYNNFARPEENLPYYDLINKGDKIVVQNGNIHIYKGPNKILESEIKEEWFLIQFE